MFCFVAIKLDQSLDDNQNCSLARNGLVWMIIKKKRYSGDYHIFLYESRGILQNANDSEVQCWVNQVLGRFPSIVNLTWNLIHSVSFYLYTIYLPPSQ